MCLSRKEALEICEEMWEYLAAHPLLSKRGAAVETGYDEMQFDCAVCEYTKQHKHNPNRDMGYVHCRLCPMWPEEKWGRPFACENHPDSRYRQWRMCRSQGMPSDASEHARAIAEHAREILALMEAE